MTHQKSIVELNGVSDLQGVKFPVFPLTLLVIVTTVAQPVITSYS